MASRLVVAHVLALALLAPAAHAASVSVFRPYCAPEQGKYGQCYPDEARYQADPGEPNKLTITRAVAPPQYTPTVTYHDDGAPVRAGSGCSQLDGHTASCSGYLLAPVVDAGDGDDVVNGSGTIDGGPGNDTITGDGVLRGGPGDDALQGGDQNDTLYGGPGRDTLGGGAGNDTLQPDDGEAGEQDTVDGGDGSDVVSYEKRRDDLAVSLEQPLAGEDRLSAVEGIRGGSGNDILTGDAGSNALYGGPGDDRLTGGDGPDGLDGGPGADVVDGGGGADTLYSGTDALHDVLACGSGFDHVGQVGAGTLVGAGCERLVLPEFELILDSIALRLPATRVPYSPVIALRGLACSGRPCTARVRAVVAAGGHRGVRVAQRSFAARRGARLPRNLQVALSRRAAALVRAGAALSVRVTIAVRDGDDRGRATFLAALGQIGLGVPAGG